MAEIIFSAVELVVMLAVLFCVRMILPKIEQDEWESILSEFRDWALIAVKWAQDRLGTEPGEDRRRAAVNALKQIRDQMGLQELITDDQVYMLVSDAYMVMQSELPWEIDTYDDEAE